MANGNATPRAIRSPTVKAAAPLPPPLSCSSPSNNHYATPSVLSIKTPNGSPVKMNSNSSSSEYQTPVSSRLPRPVMGSPISGNNKGHSGAPLSTSSPKLGGRNNVISLNVKGGPAELSPNNHWMAGSKESVKSLVIDHHDSGSLDSGSFEQDSLDGSVDFDLSALIGQSEMTVNRIISQLAVPSVGRTSAEELSDHAEASRDKLISESRQFVTASKMFVKSVTDSPQSMAVCLSQCVSLVERMGQSVEEVAQREQNRDLPAKVRDVARAFLHTLRAASEASGQGVSDPSMGRLMGKATALAGVLTILMRSLRP